MAIVYWNLKTGHICTVVDVVVEQGVVVGLDVVEGAVVQGVVLGLDVAEAEVVDVGRRMLLRNQLRNLIRSLKPIMLRPCRSPDLSWLLQKEYFSVLAKSSCICTKVVFF